MHASSKDSCQLLLHVNNVEQGVASVWRKGHHHVHIAVFGIEVIAQHGAEKLERLDVPLVAEIVDLILPNWNARRDLSDHGQNHITASPRDRPNVARCRSYRSRRQYPYCRRKASEPTRTQVL